MLELREFGLHVLFCLAEGCLLCLQSGEGGLVLGYCCVELAEEGCGEGVEEGVFFWVGGDLWYGCR